MSAKQRLPWMTTPTEPVHVAATETGVLDTHRRDFMKLLGMGGLLVVASTFGARRLESADALFAPNAEPWEPHAYVRLGDDGIITIMCHRSEMGQGIRTTMPMIIADEMEADWATCRVEQALGDDKITKEAAMAVGETAGMPAARKVVSSGARKKSDEPELEAAPLIKEADPELEKLLHETQANELNPELEKAGRVADFLELGELMCVDALDRKESCGGHFREESAETSGEQEGEAKRDDVNYMYVAAWEYKGPNTFELHKEELKYEVIKVSQRSYK